MFIDQDIEAPPGWLAALVDGARAYPDREMFGGPIRARLEGARRGCGREPAPITTLDAGPVDCDVPLVWGANMAIRRSAFARLGRFDPELLGRGDEEEFEYRYLAAGGQIRYLAAAGLDHRRDRADATIGALARAAYGQGREARRHDLRFGQARPALAGPALPARLCLAHPAPPLPVRDRDGRPGGRRIARGPVPALGVSGPDFVSGDNGLVVGPRLTARALVRDAAGDLRRLATAEPLRLARAAAQGPRRSMLVLAVEREDEPNVLAAARAELHRSRHDVHFHQTGVGTAGKFENLDRLLEAHPAAGHDWLLVVDDDVEPAPRLPGPFRVPGRTVRSAARAAGAPRPLARRLERDPPASPAASRARPAYVEIGPVSAFHADVFETLLPFPPLRAGWGLDAHWAAVATQRGWPIGVIDATAIRHGLRRIAGSYDRADALAESRAFLADKPYLTPAQANRTLRVHRNWR